MKRLLPTPVLSVVLLATWLLLNESVSAGNLALGVLFAFAIPLLTGQFLPDRPQFKNWAAVARLAAVVLRDIVVSNLDVARRVLGPEAAIASRFVWIPLRIRDPHGIVALAGIITMTPGTLSSDLSPDRKHLLVHVLHCPDDTAQAALIADIQARYENPLMEIFE
jgi:multicomponent K+:H+ antiporter subunit E